MMLCCLCTAAKWCVPPSLEQAVLYTTSTCLPACLQLLKRKNPAALDESACMPCATWLPPPPPPRPCPLQAAARAPQQRQWQRRSLGRSGGRA